MQGDISYGAVISSMFTGADIDHMVKGGWWPADWRLEPGRVREGETRGGGGDARPGPGRSRNAVMLERCQFPMAQDRFHEHHHALIANIDRPDGCSRIIFTILGKTILNIYSPSKPKIISMTFLMS